MALFPRSRYQYCVAQRDTDGNLFLDEREPFRYREEPDNNFHPVKDGDTLWGLAHRYFSGMRRPAGLWWIIAEFQPEPIIDPTIRLVVGETIIVPSQRLVETEVFSEDRRVFH